MNGNIAILKSAMYLPLLPTILLLTPLTLDDSAEITDETNEARAFSLFPICLNTGIIISSFLGGTFANTRGTKFAQMLPLFETFPYLLPMLLASVFPLLSGCLAYFYLEETLATRKEVSSENGDDPTPETSVKALFTWQISLIIFSFGIISLFGVALLALVPLFCFTALDKGGLGFDARQIGWVISQRSISVMIIQVIAFPWLQKRFGTVPLYKLCSILWIPGFVMLPLANLVARHGKEIWVWVGIYAFMLVTGLANLGFGGPPYLPLPSGPR
jgi:Na+/melibiose symporter-like transporter